MERSKLIEKIKHIFTQYRYPFLILLLGLFLMTRPDKRSEFPKSQTVETSSVIDQPSLAEELSVLLSQMEGAGEVKVLLTEEIGEEICYQEDVQASSDAHSTNERLNTVILSDSARNQTGMIRQVKPPQYQGAIILCRGADSASVRLALVEAVANAAGIKSNHISVLKMK